MASGGCSGLAIQDHIAAVRYVATDVCNVAYQLASGLQPVTLTRTVPLCRALHRGVVEDPVMQSFWRQSSGWCSSAGDPTYAASVSSS